MGVNLQAAALEAQLQSLPANERVAYLQQHMMAAQTAAQQAAGVGASMTQQEQMRFFQSLHTAEGGPSRAPQGPS